MLCRGSESLQKQISVSQKQPIAYLRKNIQIGNQPGLTSSQVKCEQCTTWEFVSFAYKNCSFKAPVEVIAKQVSAVFKQLYSTKCTKETLYTDSCPPVSKSPSTQGTIGSRSHTVQVLLLVDVRLQLLFLGKAALCSELIRFLKILVLNIYLYSEIVMIKDFRFFFFFSEWPYLTKLQVGHCYQLNLVPPKDVEALILSTCEWDLIWQHFADQYWILIGRTDAEAEAPILWPPDAKS